MGPAFRPVPIRILYVYTYQNSRQKLGLHSGCLAPGNDAKSIESFTSLWFLPLIFGSIGMVFLAVGARMVVGSRLPERKIRNTRPCGSGWALCIPYALIAFCRTATMIISPRLPTANLSSSLPH